MNISESTINQAYQQALDSLTPEEVGSNEPVFLKVRLSVMAACIVQRVSEKLNVSINDVILSSVNNYSEYRYYLAQKEKNTKTVALEKTVEEGPLAIKERIDRILNQINEEISKHPNYVGDALKKITEELESVKVQHPILEKMKETLNKKEGDKK